MKEMMEKLRNASIQAILATEDVDSLEALRVKYLGKKGELTGILRQMGRLSAEERPVMGQLANQLRAEIEDLKARLQQREKELLESKQANETLRQQQATNQQALMARLASLESPSIGTASTLATNQSREAKLVKLPSWMRLGK